MIDGPTLELTGGLVKGGNIGKDGFKSVSVCSHQMFYTIGQGSYKNCDSLVKISGTCHTAPVCIKLLVVKHFFPMQNKKFFASVQNC